MVKLLRSLFVAYLGFCALPSSAQGLIRDAELEHAMQRISAPLFEAAGLSYSGIDIYIVNSSTLNAFVLNNDIYIYAGLVQRLARVEQLQAVIAHEIGHITGSHQIQRIARIGQAQTSAGLGLLLGVAIAAVGGGNASAGIALGLGDAASKELLTFTRAQEASADQTGALILAAAGINPVAALEVFELFKGQEYINAVRQDPYTRTHPLTTTRIQYLQTVAERYSRLPKNGQGDAAYWYGRAKAKFDGFRVRPDNVLRRISSTDQSEAALMRRAIAYHRLPDKAKSRNYMNQLLALKPDDPYYHDLNAELLLESADIPSAINAYERALELRPTEAQFLAGLGRAQLALDTNAGNRAALASLQKSYARDPRNGRMLRDLSVAFAKMGQPAMASLATAERYAIRGQIGQARIHAKRALDNLPEGSGTYLRAQDIIFAANRARQ
ncbi:MAG: M48 family metalloprotease [Pseudomonadota bacterium]